MKHCEILSTAIAAMTLAGSGLLLPRVAFAQQPDARAGLEEVIVTARKREEKLLDTPIAITAISSDMIARQGISNTRDLTQHVAGITLEEQAYGNTSRISLRGLQTDAGRSSVAIMVDDIDVSTESIYSAGTGYLINMSLMDVDRIEVVKGPQAALFGRSAFGGAVNFISHRPSLTDTEATVAVDGNDYTQLSARGAVGFPLIADKLAMRVSGSIWDKEGFYTNAVTGKEIGGQKGAGAALSLLGKPTDTLSIYGKLEYSKDRWEPAAAVILPANRTVTFSPAVAAAAGGSATGSYFDGSVGEVPEDIQLSTDPATGRDYRGTEPETKAATLIIDADFDAVRLKSLSAYFDQETSVEQDADFRIPPDVPDGINPAFWSSEEWFAKTTQKVLSQELRLYSSASASWQWMVGGLYWDERSDQTQTQHLLIPIAAVPTAFVRQQLLATRFPYERDFGRDTTHYSAFAWAEVQLNDQWSASAEARYSREDADYTTRNTVQVYILGPGPSILNVSPPFPPGSQPPASVESSYVTPKLTLRYKPSAESMFYASAGKGVKPAGYTTLGTSVYGPNSLYDAETLWSYEVGNKIEFLEGRLALNSAAYYQQYKDQQVIYNALDTTLGGLTPTQYTKNAARSNRWGIELEAAWRVTENFSMSGNYSYVNAKFGDYTVLSNDAGRIAEAGCARVVPVGPGTQCELDYSGNIPGHTPKNQLNVMADWSAPESATLAPFAQVSARFVSDRFANDANTAILESYWRADVAAGLRWGNSELMAYVENVTDDRTIADGFVYFDYQTPTFQPDLFTLLSKPRTFGVRYLYRSR